MEFIRDLENVQDPLKRNRMKGKWLIEKAYDYSIYDVQNQENGNYFKQWLQTRMDSQLELMVNHRFRSVKQGMLWLYTNNIISVERLNKPLYTREDYITIMMWNVYYMDTGIVPEGFEFLDNGVVSISERKIDVFFKKIDISSCPICLSDNIDVTEVAQPECGHSICYSCFTEYITKLHKDVRARCSICRGEITSVSTFHKNDDFLH